MTNMFNVEATLNQWLGDSIGAATLPAWLPSVAVVFTMPEIETSLPCFSVHHIPVAITEIAHGRVTSTTAAEKGQSASALMEVNAWVTRQDANWSAQLRTMTDIVVDAVVSTPSVIVSDYTTNPYTPSATAYLVRLESVEIVATQADENPDIERRRMLVNYRWIYRTS